MPSSNPHFARLGTTFTNSHPYLKISINGDVLPVRHKKPLYLGDVIAAVDWSLHGQVGVNGDGRVEEGGTGDDLVRVD